MDRPTTDASRHVRWSSGLRATQRELCELDGPDVARTIARDEAAAIVVEHGVVADRPVLAASFGLVVVGGSAYTLFRAIAWNVVGARGGAAIGAGAAIALVLGAWVLSLALRRRVVVRVTTRDGAIKKLGLPAGCGEEDRIAIEQRLRELGWPVERSAA